ncbi:MAG: EFR1 family ferrodoxin [Peptoniphilaceae bacterium]|nr:EFR1 family ferrodoxin [Peptoniphilaceae bacterium]
MDIILYFTGNCLHCAKLLEAKLGNVERIRLESKLDIARTQEKLDGAQRVGIILPVYAGTLPYMARELLKEFRFRDTQYLYAIATCAGSALSIHYDIDQVVRKTSNRGLDYWHTLTYPSNFQTNMAPKDPEAVEGILNAVEADITEMAQKVASEVQVPVKSQKVLSRLAEWSLHLAVKKDRSNKFYADENCIGCGMSQKSCPAENIELIDQKPTWSTHCEACMACIGICPTRAIQYGTKTQNWGRYLNPRVRKDELFVD